MVRDNLQKVTLNLRAGDYDRLREFHPDLPAALVVRKLVSDYIDKMETKMQEQIESITV